MCVCVCVRERETGRDETKERRFSCMKRLTSAGMLLESEKISDSSSSTSAYKNRNNRRRGRNQIESNDASSVASVSIESETCGIDRFVGVLLRPQWYTSCFSYIFERKNV